MRHVRVVGRSLLILSLTLAALVGAAAPVAADEPPPLTEAQQVIAIAVAQKGARWEFAATGPNQFDCSGLVKYVFSRVGKALPRTSSEMRRATARVANGSKVPGDLVFIHSSSGRVTHVGVYAGNHSMWVAPKAGDVVKYQRIYTGNYSIGRMR